MEAWIVRRIEPSGPVYLSAWLDIYQANFEARRWEQDSKTPHDVIRGHVSDETVVCQWCEHSESDLRKELTTALAERERVLAIVEEHAPASRDDGSLPLELLIPEYKLARQIRAALAVKPAEGGEMSVNDTAEQAAVYARRIMDLEARLREVEAEREQPVCPDCKNTFLQPFRCVTCGAQKLHDAALANAQKRAEALAARLREVEQAIPSSFYSEADLIFRQTQLVRVWNNAVKANAELEARLREEREGRAQASRDWLAEQKRANEYAERLREVEAQAGQLALEEGISLPPAEREE